MTTHRHKDSRSQWTTYVTDPDLSVYATKLDLAALAARVATLEGEPTAPPAERYFPLPVTSQAVSVPVGIDGTGSSDVTAPLNAFIASVPDGSLILFPAGKTYKISGMLNLQGRNNLIVDGAGSTLLNVANANANGLGGSYWFSFFGWSWSGTKPTHITIRNFNAVAASPSPGTLQPGEHAGFLLVMGGSYIELDNITTRGLFGDLSEINEDPDHVWFHDCHVIDCGRNGVSMVCGSDILIERNAFDSCGYCTFDIEPEATSIAGITRCVFRGNVSGRWTNCFFSMDGANSGKPITDVEISGNRSVGYPLFSSPIGSPGSRPQRVTFTDNWSDTARPGPALTFRYVDSVIVTGNTQPLTAGSLASFISCTGIVQS